MYEQVNPYTADYLSPVGSTLPREVFHSIPRDYTFPSCKQLEPSRNLNSGRHQSRHGRPFPRAHARIRLVADCENRIPPGENFFEHLCNAHLHKPYNENMVTILDAGGKTVLDMAAVYNISKFHYQHSAS